MILTREDSTSSTRSVQSVVGAITDLCFNVLDTFYMPLVVESNLVSLNECLMAQ